MLGAAALPFVASLLVVWLLVPLARMAASRWGYVDLPRADRAHVSPTPRLGGAAVAAAVIVPLAPWWGSVPVGIAAGALLAVALGLVDDRRPLRPAAKLAGQAIAAAALISAGWGACPVWALALAAFWTVALMNAANLLDNQDGALSAAALPAAAALGAIALLLEAPAAAAASFALAGAIAGFLRFNRPVASIFLGDAGSLGIGFALSALTLALASRAGDLPRALAPGFAVAYPLFDLVFVTSTRIAEGRRIDQGGVDHTTHRLTRALGSVGRADGVIAAVSAAFGVMAVARFLGGSWTSFAVSTAVALGFFAWMGMALLRVRH